MRTIYQRWLGRARLWVGSLITAAVGLFVATAVVFAQGGDNPQPPPSWLTSPGSPASSSEASLYYIIFTMAVIIFIGVEGLLLYSIFRYRQRQAVTEEPAQVYGNARLELAWTIVPALILVAIALLTLQTLRRVTTPPDGPTTEVDVIGHQWQWEIRYPEAPDFSSTNVLTVPVGSVVKINLTSTDVIHSFWVPELAGKTDAMPHITNTMWFRADSPRTYRGQCAEFCGLLHSRMWLDVVAIPQETYNQWFASIKPQGTPIAQPPTQGGPELGQALFQRGGGGATPCSVCHSLQPGVQIVGPSLAGVATRAAGREPGKNAHDYLKESIVDPNAFIVPGFSKPSPMPGNFGQVYSDEQIESLVAFLMTQK